MRPAELVELLAEQLRYRVVEELRERRLVPEAEHGDQ